MMATDPEPVAGLPPTDHSLLHRFRAGEDAAATELYTRYAERLFSVATAKLGGGLQQRVDPEDIVQSVFRTFFRRAALGQYEVPAGEELWKLFLVIGLNKIREVAVHHHAGKRDLRQTAGGGAADAVVGENHAIAETALRMAIDDVLAPLPETHREIVRLRVERYEVAEIAARVGRSKRSVERILSEFQQKLHGLIDGK